MSDDRLGRWVGPGEKEAIGAGGRLPFPCGKADTPLLRQTFRLKAVHAKKGVSGGFYSKETAPLTRHGAGDGIPGMRLACLLFASLSATLLAAPVELVTPDLRDAIQPQIVVAPAGGIHVVFEKGSAVYHTASADGSKFSVPVKVGELEKLALGKRRGPRVAVSDGLVLVTAISSADGNLHTWTSSDKGQTWKEGSALNSKDGSAREGLQALASDGRGHIVAVWPDSRAGGMEEWGRVSHDGGKTWGPDERIYGSPSGSICPCCVPSVAISPKGKVAVMWRNSLEGSRDLHLATRSGDQPFSPAIKLGAGTWKLEGCPMDGGGLAFSPGGNWLAVWRREKAIFASFAEFQEMPLSDDASQPVAAYAGNTPVLLWESGGNLMMKRGDAPAAKFADGGKFASVVSGKDAAYLVWEGTATDGRTLLFERLR